MNAAHSFSDTASDCGLYIHVPFCVRKCRYCAFYSVVGDVDLQRRYFSELRRELQMHEFGGRFCTGYIGGGSPSSLEASLLKELAVWTAGLLEKNAELTIEVNPAQDSKELFISLKDLGANRVSIGAQSFIQGQLEFLGRLHSVGDIYACVDAARLAGFENIGLDLIYALPGSSLAEWKTTLSEALRLAPAHISAYALTYEQGSVLTEQMEKGEITPVDDKLDRAMYETAIERLASAGYRQYEISNFAREGFQCRHNLRYWQNLPYIGLGPSAAGWYRGRRTENIPDLHRYIETINKGQFAYETDQPVGSAQHACETAVLGLRTRTGINLEQFRKQTGFDATELFGLAIERHLAGGWLETDGHFLRLSRKALAVADSILCDFADI